MKKPLVTIRQDRNGVRVTKRVYEDGATVESPCACYGMLFRVHSNPECPRLGGRVGGAV